MLRIVMSVKFSLMEASRNASASAASFTAFSISPEVGGSFKKSGAVLVFVPDEELASNERYTVRVDGSLADTAGEQLGEEVSFSFTTAYGEVIKTSKELAARMAEVAVGIKDTIIEAMEVETANGFAHLLFEKVKQTLVHDLTVKDFASMYAQTIVYGFFSARCLDKTPEDFSVEEAIELIPSTNPFLKGLMKDCRQW